MGESWDKPCCGWQIGCRERIDHGLRAALDLGEDPERRDKEHDDEQVQTPNPQRA